MAPSASINDSTNSSFCQVHNAVLGNLLIKAWYPSFYPRELDTSGQRDVDRLYICQSCFKYSNDLVSYLAHVKTCINKNTHVGELLYSQGDIDIYHVDGAHHKLYAQNLCLFAKLFLDTKSVFYDVSTFRYYTMVRRDSATHTAQVVGFFSKEKMSWDNNNVACILVFPPWQRQGLGQTLIGISYELSRRSGRIGGPEKPLSTHGKRGYELYWCAAVCRALLNHKKDRGTLSLQDLSAMTFMLPEDVTTALRVLGISQDSEQASVTPREILVDAALLQAWARKHAMVYDTVISAKALKVLPDQL